MVGVSPCSMAASVSERLACADDGEVRALQVGLQQFTADEIAMLIAHIDHPC